jgi:hypothetical protein
MALFFLCYIQIELSIFRLDDPNVIKKFEQHDSDRVERETLLIAPSLKNEELLFCKFYFRKDLFQG